MRINNLKINSFGKLENRDLEFRKFNLIYGDNEAGKSTLLNYIMHMFYGMNKSKSSKSNSDYDRFCPWNSNYFSGQINYDLDDGSNYRVYRDFDKKETFIYDKNNTEISNLFSVDKKLGNQFLLDQIRLDRDLLEKTFVINQNSLKVLKNDRDELIQKISNLIESGSEEISYEKLQKKLVNLQLENVGSDRSSDRPYNIAKEKFEKNSSEINYLKNVNDDKYVINKKISDVDEKIEINSEKIESVNIAKNKFKEFNLINEKIKLKEEYYDDESDDEINHKNNKMIFVILGIIFLVLFIFNFLKIKNNLINFILSGLFLLNIFSYFVINSFKRKNIKKITLNNKQKIYDEIKDEKIILKNNIEKFKNELINQYGNYVERYFNNDIDIIYNELINEKNSLILERKKLELEYSNILPKLERYVNLVEEQEILKDELINLAKKNAGYSIAKKLLEEAYVEIKNSVTPKFFDNLSDVVKTITNGKYVKVYVNDEIEVEDYLGKIYSIDKLSFGTIEEIYFSLRVSIALMISEEKFPIILDESFVYFDDNRLRSILNYLYSLDNQIIILSSNKREKNLLDFENYDYNFIQL
jgi:SMC protein-like protein